MVSVNTFSPVQKKFCKSVKLLRETIPTLQYGDYIATTDKEKADTFFASCWNSSELPLSEEAYSNQSTYDDLEVII